MCIAYTIAKIASKYLKVNIGHRSPGRLIIFSITCNCIHATDLLLGHTMYYLIHAISIKKLICMDIALFLFIETKHPLHFHPLVDKCVSY